ncbi:hypothetical protein ANMWB30_27070 [Arthrobacter sp. MWB30]|nr:hypothetical protein ANMWB30_27070 [Arthrobacter sp. MWB30]
MVHISDVTDMFQASDFAGIAQLNPVAAQKCQKPTRRTSPE